MKRMLVLSGLVFLAASLSATTIHVPADQPTIQAGIDAASEGDTVLVADGIYTGAGNRDVSIVDRRLVISSEGGPENTIIDCEADTADPHRAFFITGMDTLGAIIGLTIRGGCAERGGGLLVENSSLAIINCRFDYNRAVTDSANSSGGAIWLAASSRIESCSFDSNHCSRLGGAVIVSAGAPVFVNCSFNNNSAGEAGGAIDVRGNGSVLIDSCVFELNHAVASAGAVYGALSSSVTIRDCLFRENRAANGGGRFMPDKHEFDKRL